MPKISIAIAAFALGLFSSTLFNASQSQHPGSSRPKIQWPDLHTWVLEGGSARDGGSMFNADDIGAIPFFNSLDHMPVFKRFKIVSRNTPLDGLNCEDCEFNNANLRYGGGVVNLKGSAFSGTTTLQLEGAAANTVALLEFLRAIPKGSLSYKLPIPNKAITRKFASTTMPVRQKASTPQPQKMEFTSPFIGGPK